MDLSRISKKSPHEDSRLTLTAIDSRTMENFNKYYETLPDKKNLLAQLVRKKNGIRTKYSNEYHYLCKKIQELESEINDIVNNSHQINYLMKAASHFLEYSSANNQNTQIIDDNKGELINGFFIKKNKTNKGKICKEYIKECIGDGYSLNTKSSELEINQELTCKNCGVEKLTNPRESYASCPMCGEVTKYQDTQNNKGEYSEEVEVLSPFAYKRINHFKEWINTLMGREGSGPSQDVIDKLLRELRKDRITRREDVTYERIKYYLKKIKHPKLYEHIPAIIFKICKIPPPPISPETEEKFFEMFQKIQNPFEKCAPSWRKNFLSYPFIIHKFSQLLGETHLLANLQLLRSREKLYQHDKIWKGICKELGYKFIPSL